MGDDSDLFTDAQRHSIGVCVSQLGEHVRTLRGFGLSGPNLDKFEQALDEVADEAGAKKPQPPRNPSTPHSYRCSSIRRRGAHPRRPRAAAR
jgi:hypothetical protein